MVRGKRSPHFPFITLEKALWRASQYYKAEGRAAAKLPVAVSHWSYKPKSSGGLQTIAALKAYGLISDEGSAQNRRIRLTELALRILLDERENSPDRHAYIAEAALKPKVFRTAWEEWGSDGGLPSPENMKHTLIFELGFNENSAGDFVRIFTANLGFAGLDPSTSVEESERLADNVSSDENSEIQTPLQRRQTMSTASATAHASHQDVFSLKEGNAVMQWPRNLSNKSAEYIEDWLKIVLRKVKDSVGEDDESED